MLVKRECSFSYKLNVHKTALEFGIMIDLEHGYNTQ